MEFNGATTGSLSGDARGGATIISLVTVLAAFLMATGYLYMAQADLRMSTREMQSRQALYLAEAGIELARSELAANASWRPLPSYVLGSGTFSLVVSPDGSGYLVTATGRAGQAVKKVEVNLKRTDSGWAMTSYREVYN